MEFMNYPDIYFTPELEFRFTSKVKRISSGCWIWIAALFKNGYGHYWDNGYHVYAHRYAYEKIKGIIPEGLEIDHLCRNRACVNPDHLEAVTRHENIIRGAGPKATRIRSAQITHCPQGHEYTPFNTYRDKRGNRHCMACIYKRTYERNGYAEVPRHLLHRGV